MHYIKVYIMLCKQSISALFAYKANFINTVIGNLSWGFFSVFLIFVLTSRSSSVYGLSRNELLLLTGLYNVVMSIFWFLFYKNFQELSRIIHFGKLDAYVLRPIDTQFLLSTYRSNLPALLRFFIGIGFTTYVLHAMQQSISLIGVFGFIVFIFFGISTLYAVWYIILTNMVWNSSLSNLIDILDMITGIARYPQKMFAGLPEIIYFIVFPITLVINVPLRILLQKATAIDMVEIVLVSLGLLFISRIFWQFAMRSYASVSS